jgi:hypothetical protein
MVKTISTFIVAALLLSLVSGCASHPLKGYDGVGRQPKSDIDVYEDGNVPNKRYKIIMEFSAKGDGGKEAKIHRSFIEQAKKYGGDAIILKPNQGGFSAGIMGAKSINSYSAIAVVYQ